MFKKGVAISLSFFYFTSICCANESGYLEFGAGFYKVTYSERDSSFKQLNKENGVLPNLFVNAGWNLENISIFSKAVLSQSQVDYVGHTQTYQALQTTTDTSRSEYEIGAAYQFHDSAALILSASKYYWDREIRGTRSSLPLAEYYRWKNFKLGFDIRLFKRDLDQLNVQFTCGKLFDEHLEVDLSDIGYGQPVIPLKGELYNKIQLRYTYSWTPTMDLRFNTSFTRINFDQSEAKKLSKNFSHITIREPQSTTGVVGMSLSLVVKI